MGDSQARSSGETITTHELLERSARRALGVQRTDGSFPPGRNYSYDEQETPVRTTAQWIRTLARVFEITGESAFEAAANRAVDYLLGDERRPYGYTYHCRDAEGKDHCNGLVGQASVIRAFAFAADVLDRADARETAINVFDLHPFDDELGLWERVEIDGRPLSFDRTLNHQLLFAGAASGLAADSALVSRRIECHLDKLSENMYTHSNGLIKHYARPPVPVVIRAVLRTPRHRVMLRNELLFHYFSHSAKRRQKERGYQTVNLVALAEIDEAFPTHPFWDSDEFEAATAFLREHDRELIDGVATRHGSALQGVAVARIRNRFEETSSADLRDLIAADLARDPTAGDDPFKPLDVDDQTAAALVSELVDLPSVEIPVA